MLRAATSRLARGAARPFAEQLRAGWKPRPQMPGVGEQRTSLGSSAKSRFDPFGHAQHCWGRHFPKLRRFKQEAIAAIGAPNRLGGFGCDAKVRSERGSRAAQMLTLLQ